MVEGMKTLILELVLGDKLAMFLDYLISVYVSMMFVVKNHV